MTDLVRTAIVYDFDGTLAPGNMQEHSFIPGHGADAAAFWARVKTTARETDSDEILVYMREMILLARQHGLSITRKSLAEHGDVPLFSGLDEWFERVDARGRAQGLQVEHYVISSGLREMIEGCRIHRRFTNVFASHFIYDERGEAVWPGVAINYTTKTQFLFRINKGIASAWDNEQINRWMPMDERPIPFSRMVFIGDGATDIPAMKTVCSLGGHSIAVFDPKKWAEPAARTLIARLISENRAQSVAPADYTDGSQLDVTVQGVLGRIARDAGFRDGRP